MERRELIGLPLAVLAAAGPAAARPPFPPLPFPRARGALSVEQALARRRSVRHFAETPLTVQDASQLLWAGQGITSALGQRTAPSAGALYPLRLRLVTGHVGRLQPGVFRYEPRGHRLGLESPGDVRARLAAAARQDWVSGAPALVVISAEAGRTRARYGERAGRFVHIECGAAAQNIYLQAGALGLATTAVGAFDETAVGAILGLASGEAPLLLMPIGRPAGPAPS
jgi:SagB-type dehydrogenase family enzyme